MNTHDPGLTTGASGDVSPDGRAAMTRGQVWRGAFVAVTLAVGAALFVRSVRTIGVHRVADGLARVGWGFAIIVALSGAREAARTLAWMRSVEGPLPLGFGNAFRARLAGEALSMLLPMGILAGEPAKAAQVGSQIPFATAFAAIAVEFAFYTCSLLVLLGAGGLTLLATEHVRWPLLLAALAALNAGGLGMAGLLRARARRASVAPDVGRTLIAGLLAPAVASVKRLENVVLGFGRRHPDRLLSIAALETTYHALGLAEVYVTLWFISPVPPTIAAAVVLETVGRVVIMAFKFLPMRVGIDEAGAGAFAARLGLGAATGITLALVRKVRMLFWSAVGLAMLVRTPPALKVRREQAAGLPHPGL